VDVHGGALLPAWIRPTARRGRSPPRAVTGLAPLVHERSPAVARRRRRGAQPFLPRLPSSPTVVHTGKGKNPNATWPAGGAQPRVVGTGSRQRRGKDTACALVGWRGDAPTWRRGSGWCRCFRHDRGRAEGSFPPGETPRRAHGRALARRACQPAARPSHRACALVRHGGVAEWRDAEQRGKVEKKKEEGG
jgi:hypothetical protein